VRAMFRSLRDAWHWLWNQMCDVQPIRILHRLAVMLLFWGEDPP
jgi:hypothetical protein